MLLGQCGGRPVLTVERREARACQAVAHLNAPCQTHLDQSPLALEPGETRTETFSVQEPGEYRVGTEWGTGVGFVGRRASSEPFVVTVP